MALPVELLEVIFDSCEIASLKTVRLACKQYCDIATRRVFENFHLAMLDEKLKHLRPISKSPLATHVKAFTFWSDVLPSFGPPVQHERENWEGTIDCRPDMMNAHMALRRDPVNAMLDTSNIKYLRVPVTNGTSSGRLTFTNQELEAGWREVQRLREEQQAWKKEDTITRFKEYSCQLPNITQAQVLHSTALAERSSRSRIWKRLRPRMLAGPHEWLGRRGQHTLLDDSDQAIHLRCGMQAIGFRASRGGIRQIEKLDVRASLRGRLQDLYMDTMQGQKSRCRLLHEAFKHVSNLTLGVPDAHLFDCELATELVSLLHSATKLRTLNFAYVRNEKFINGPAGSLVDNPPHWPQIRDLSLNTANTGSGALLELLRHLAPTLCSLKLYDLKITDGIGFVKQIPEILQLRRVYLERIVHR
ncbi:hypothetical protein LTR09_000087 [Extremus antarcticus]|uniref:F-box domain-containing protein n=1 Tax=Extremus antarcticus TaxID=702011 RepID=A0AAJ0GJ55_9PEZI|nr:hypothetical protein LTR09_000087 [Extremus antarcticus]